MLEPLAPLACVLALLVAMPLDCGAQAAAGGAGTTATVTQLAPPATADAPADLLDIYQQARSADPVLAAADAARGSVREGVALARAPLLPQASVGIGYEQTHGSVDGRQQGRGVAATLSQTLVDVGQLARLQAARATADAQDALYRSAEQALLLRVASAYFNVLSAAETLANVRANEEAFAQQVQQAGERYRNGLSAALDVEQARAYHATARANTIAASKALADAREALAEITGRSPGTLRALRDTLPLDMPSPAEPQAWVDSALANNPLLLAQRASIVAADRSVDAARAAHLPTVSAGLSTGRNGSWPLAGANDGRNVTTVGLTLSLPLFAGGSTQALVRQAQYQRSGAGNELESRRRSVMRSVLDQYRSVVAGIGQTQATRDAVEAARKALASVRVGQSLGTQSTSDLLIAIQILGAAQNAHALARHQFILSQLLLQQAAGTVDESHLAAINTLLQ